MGELSRQRDGQDRFDAVIGLVGMLQVVLAGCREAAPSDPEIRRWERWILGQV